MRSYDLFLLSLLLWWLLLVLLFPGIFGPVDWPGHTQLSGGWKSRLASKGQSQVEIEGEDLSVPIGETDWCGFGWDRNWYMDEISMKSGWYPDDIAAIASPCSTFLMATERPLFFPCFHRPNRLHPISRSNQRAELAPGAPTVAESWTRRAWALGELGQWLTWHAR